MTYDHSGLPIQESVEVQGVLPGLEIEATGQEVKKRRTKRAKKEQESEEALLDESPVFPPNVYSSTKVRGARKASEDESDLDLRIEGLLFVTNVPLTPAEIAGVLGVPKDSVKDTLRVMVNSFARRRSALELRERVKRGKAAFIIDLDPVYRPVVKPLAAPALAKRFIDTLALIALNQPVPQSRLVRERGQKVYDHVRELVERGLVKKTRKGLSYDLRTTARFASEFGLSSNPRDLRAMLARSMTEEEKATWEEYRLLERAKKDAARAKLYGAPPVEESEAYEVAVEEAARLLSAEKAPSQLATVGGAKEEASQLHHLEESSGINVAGFEASPGGHGAAVPSIPKSLVTASSGSTSEAEQEEANLTKFEKLFLRFKKQQH